MERPTEVDGSEDVNDFLVRIRELGNKRDKEDEERARKLEEEILQGRRERQARRAERARSISPTKDSPGPFDPALIANDAQSSPTPSQPIDPPLTLLPSAHKENFNITPAAEGTKDAEMAKPDGLTRSVAGTSAGPLAWKQRPGSKGFDAGSIPSPTLPMSIAPIEPHSKPTATPETDSNISRNSIAQSLGSKDPSWFRQTADRGIGSPAYRRAQDSSVSDVSSMSGNTRLPGFSRESTLESEKSTNNDSVGERSRSPSRASSIYGTGTSSVGNRYSSISSVSTAGGLGSPVPLSSSQRLESRGSFTATDSQSADRFAMSPSQGRLASDRPSSPTKGLGGFVQSAMMKRSDSVSKRWSAQPTGRNSISSKPGYQPPTTLSREPSDETSQLSNSRPGSSHSEATVVRHPAKGESTDPTKPGSRGGTLPNDGFVKASLPSRSLSRSNSISTAGEKLSDLPTTPSKTMEPRRWSPTKSSWLESALNKPDSPKPKAQAPQEPEWKRGLNKLKQSKASVDLGRPSSPGSFIQKENQPPARPSQISPESSSQVGKRELPSEAKLDSPNSEIAPELENGGLRIKTSANQPQPPEKPQNLDDLMSGIISPPKERGGSPAASSPVGSQKGFESHRKPTLDGIPPKPKPQTPPLNDFRANLRRREIPDDSSSKNEPEFKNVFAKLRKTETKNYVAPDVFKDNILRGKAGLNVTGGPKPNQRVDEFKESILKQKEAMKAGGGSIRRPTIEDKGPSGPEKASPPVPEALSRRRALTKSGSITNKVSGSDSVKSPEELKNPSFPKPTQPSGSTLSNPPSPDKPLQPTPGPQTTTNSSSMNSPEIAAKTGIAESVRNLSSEDLADSSAKIDSPSSHIPSSTTLHSDRRGLEQVSKRPSLASTFDRPPALKSQQSEPLAGTGKLANRLNPALAGILSRGPPGRNESPGASNNSSPSISSRAQSSSQVKLTHATKSRAKGPKRRLPQAAKLNDATQRNDDGSPPRVESPTKQSLPAVKSSSNRISLGASPVEDDVPSLRKKTFSQKTTSDIFDTPSTPNEQKRSKDKPAVYTKSPELRKFTPTSNESQKEESVKEVPAGGLEFLPATKYVEPESPSPPRPITQRNTSSDYFKVNERKPSPPRKPASIISPKMTSSPQPDSPQNSSKPLALSGKGSIGSITAGASQNIGFEKRSPQPSPLQQRKLPSPQPQRTSSPPAPRKPCNTVSNQPNAPAISSKPSPFPEAPEAVNLFSSFFDSAPKASDKVEVDPQVVLSSRPDVFPKITTLTTQIWEITGDGKRKDLPANQGYILYEESMYICVHAFEVAGGSKTTHVNLWCGDSVSEAAIEDAQLFARKAARENSCKLELVKQGKEAPSFIQALGGIIITRRGSSSRANSSAMYMLCGRRHMAQVAFDEVELSARSLCSGYPFLISAKFGKLYLWQGRGSTADELGCARLIGMDLGLTGEIEEVIEGKEPEGFFDTFPDSSGKFEHSSSVEHWQHKPTNEKYCCRLYRVDHELGQRFGSGFWSRRGTSSPVTRPNDIIQEIMPFCQRDLDPTHVHVLDTFFEIFVIVGDRANARSAEFASALVFAQEYSIMAVSLQDRPFLPKSSVVMYGLPDECKQAFRKWEDRGNAISPRKRASVVPLNAAIEAIR